MLLTDANAAELKAAFINHYSNIIDLNATWRAGPRKIEVTSAVAGRNGLLGNKASEEAFFCINISARDADGAGIFTAKEDFYYIGYVEADPGNASRYVVKPFLGGLARGTGACTIHGEQTSMPRILARYPAARPSSSQ